MSANGEKWFTDRIGKIIYRNRSFCKCSSCETVRQTGLVIFDKSHALYLAEIEGLSHYEGDENPIKYFDTIEERDKHVKNNK